MPWSVRPVAVKRPAQRPARAGPVRSTRAPPTPSQPVRPASNPGSATRLPAGAGRPPAVEGGAGAMVGAAAGGSPGGAGSEEPGCRNIEVITTAAVSMIATAASTHSAVACSRASVTDRLAAARCRGGCRSGPLPIPLEPDAPASRPANRPSRPGRRSSRRPGGAGPGRAGCPGARRRPGTLGQLVLGDRPGAGVLTGGHGGCSRSGNVPLPIQKGPGARRWPAFSCVRYAARTRRGTAGGSRGRRR